MRNMATRDGAVRSMIRIRSAGAGMAPLPAGFREITPWMRRVSVFVSPIDWVREAKLLAAPVGQQLQGN